MTEQSLFPIAVQPVISYPREAEVGKTYLMTIDLQVVEGSEWQFEEEEYPIYCIVESEPLFKCKALGESAIVLHRFGGSYGAAKFLLTPMQEMKGEIRLTLINIWGFPIKQISLAASNQSKLASSILSPLITKQHVSNKSNTKQFSTSRNQQASQWQFEEYLRGDVNAGIHLVLYNRRLVSGIRTIARRFCGDEGDDATQAAWLKLIEAIRSYKFLPSFCLRCLRDSGCTVRRDASLINITKTPTALSALWELDSSQKSIYLCFDATEDVAAASNTAPVIQVYPGHPLLNAIFSLREEHPGDEDWFYRWSMVITRNAILSFARQTTRQSERGIEAGDNLGIYLDSTEEVEYESFLAAVEYERALAELDSYESLLATVEYESVLAAIDVIDRQYPQKHFWELCQRLLQGESQQEIAFEFKVSPAEISRRKKQLKVLVSRHLGLISEEDAREALKRRRLYRDKEYW